MKKVQRSVNVEAKETMKDVDALGVHDVPERGVRKETLEKFGVKVAVS